MTTTPSQVAGAAVGLGSSAIAVKSQVGVGSATFGDYALYE